MPGPEQKKEQKPTLQNKRKPKTYLMINDKEYEVQTMAKGGRIGLKAGSGEKMRKKGAKGAPTAKNFKRAKQTARS